MGMYKPRGIPFEAQKGLYLIPVKCFTGCTGCFYNAVTNCKKPVGLAHCLASVRDDHYPVVFKLHSMVKDVAPVVEENPVPCELRDFVDMIFTATDSTRAERQTIALLSVGRSVLHNTFDSIYFHALAKYASGSAKKSLAYFFTREDVRSAYSKKYAGSLAGFKSAIAECLESFPEAGKEISKFTAMFNFKGCKAVSALLKEA
jgi:hypothetical protein